MDEAVRDCSGTTVASEQAVSSGKGLPEGNQRLSQILRCVIIVMQVDLDLAESAGAERGESIQVFRFVLFNRVKECVTRWPAVRIAESREESGVFTDPMSDATARDLGARAGVFGLEVVSDAKQEMSRLARLSRTTPTDLRKVGDQPAVEAAEHRHHGASARTVRAAPERNEPSTMIATPHR